MTGAGPSRPSISPSCLDGVRILDLSRLLPGPFATMLLADLGADVIKVEPPNGGDPLRAVSPEIFASINRNKRSLTLDVRRKPDRETFLRLVGGADAVVESFRPGALAAAGLSYARLRKANPRIVLCSITAFGQWGPYARRPGHDVNCLALSGFFAVPGRPDGVVDRVGVRVGDLSGAMYAALTLVVAMTGAASSGSGRHLDVSLHEAASAWAAPFALPALNSVGADRTLTGDNDVFFTADNRRLSFAAFEDKFWLAFRTAVASEFPELRTDRFDRRAERTRAKREVNAMLARTFRARSLSWWSAALDDVDIPWAPVYDHAEDLLDDDHVRDRRMFHEVDSDDPAHPWRQMRFPVLFGTRPEGPHRPAPSLGEHSEEVLAELRRLRS